MNVLQIVVIVFAIASVSVSGFAVWYVATAPGVRFKPLWILGSLFGFVGLSTSLSSPGDIYLHFGVQIPGIWIWAPGGGDIMLRGMFPLVALVAIDKFRPSKARADD